MACVATQEQTASGTQLELRCYRDVDAPTLRGVEPLDRRLGPLRGRASTVRRSAAAASSSAPRALERPAA